MPQQSTGFMQTLDQWTEETILDPLYDAWKAVERAPDSEVAEECQEHFTQVVSDAKRAIREKVLESYRNGQKAGPARPQLKPRQSASGGRRAA